MYDVLLQELFAHGMTNVVGSFFSSYCSSASLSRSVVQDEVGGKTQVSKVKVGKSRY
jgi:MFS superfamily sulfate permease-like transporter